ncbi:hypothetical protein [Legionella londiniensis]|uniref:Uncharacterized protein n=1 Tax=Legionella londiniensis TaxID=45068 RepID=A0A0W0VHQ5_9GAMM|nr:hypothetical protein [Legionella londiniensis]KTD19653.1 hypothetical protein Llon_1825 [Legionella londiniensis]STX92437.1 Uncharacterised protein [Legionella londiniensis]
MTSKIDLTLYTDMPENLFLKRLNQVDWQAFAKKPEAALKAAGVILKKDITVKLVANKHEAQSLPATVLPIFLTKEKKQVVDITELGKVTGGRRPTGSSNPRQPFPIGHG